MNGGIGVWVAAEWRRKWPALVGLAVLVALAGGVATALAAGARRADSAYARFLDVTGQPNLAAQVQLSGDNPATREEAERRFSSHVEVLDELAAVDGVEHVEVESWLAISLAPELDPAGRVTAFATGTFAEAGVPGQPIVIDGRLPDVTDPDSIVVNEVATRDLGVEVGDTMRFATASPGRLLDWVNNDGQFASRDALDGPAIEVRVAAVIRSDEDFEAPFPLVRFPEGFVRAHRDDIAHVEPFIYLRVDPDRRDAVAADVAAVLEPYGVSVTTATTTPGEAIIPSIDVGVTTLWIATAVAVVAGLLLVAQALGRLVAASAAEHPALSAMGMTHAERAAGSGMLAMVGIAAGALAVPFVAFAASRLFPRGAAAFVEPDPGLRWDWPALATGAVVTLAATSALLVLLAAGGSVAAPRRSSGGPLLTRLFGARPTIALGASFAGDPAGGGRRSRVVAVATAASIAFAVGATLAVATLDASRDHLKASPSLYGAPAELIQESNGSFGLAEVVDGALRTSGVTAVIRHLAINDDVAQANGPAGPAEVEPAAYDAVSGSAHVPLLEGRLPLAPDEVALGSQTARDLGAAIGDVVTVDPPAGGEPMPLRVSGLVSSWDTADPKHAFVVEPDTLRAVLCPDVVLDECNLTIDIYASVGDEEARAALIDADFVPVKPPANVDRLDEVGPVPWLLAGFLGVFAAAGLLHAVWTSARRRTRDLAIARALGLGARRASSALTWQAVLTAGVGSAAGVLLGAIAGPAIWRGIAGDLGVIVVPRFPAAVAAAAVAAAIVAAAVVSIWPRRRATTMRTATALRAE